MEPDPRLVGRAVRPMVRRAAPSTSPSTASTVTLQPGNGDRVAIHFEGEPGDTRTLTYADLQREVSQAAHALTELGIRPATASRSTCR